MTFEELVPLDRLSLKAKATVNLPDKEMTAEIKFYYERPIDLGQAYALLASILDKNGIVLLQFLTVNLPEPENDLGAYFSRGENNFKEDGDYEKTDGEITAIIGPINDDFLNKRSPLDEKWQSF